MALARGGMRALALPLHSVLPRFATAGSWSACSWHPAAVPGPVRAPRPAGRCLSTSPAAGSGGDDPHVAQPPSAPAAAAAGAPAAHDQPPPLPPAAPPPPWCPTLDVPRLDASDVPLLSQRWERRRLSWLVTGSVELGGSGGSSGELPSALAARLATLRRARKRKPVKVNVKSILAVMQDPARANSTVTFTKALPLAHMVGIMGTVWEAAGLYGPGGGAGGGAGAGGAPGAALVPPPR